MIQKTQMTQEVPPNNENQSSDGHKSDQDSYVSIDLGDSDPYESSSFSGEEDNESISHIPSQLGDTHLVIAARCDNITPHPPTAPSPTRGEGHFISIDVNSLVSDGSAEGRTSLQAEPSEQPDEARHGHVKKHLESAQAGHPQGAPLQIHHPGVMYATSGSGNSLSPYNPLPDNAPNCHFSLSNLPPDNCTMRHLSLRNLFPESYHRDYDANLRIATVTFFTNGVWEALDIGVKPETTGTSLALVVPPVFLTAAIINFIRALWEQRRCDHMTSIINDSFQLGIKFASGAALYITFNTPAQTQLGLATTVDWLMSGLSAGFGSMAGLFVSVFGLGLANAAYTYRQQRLVNTNAINNDDIEAVSHGVINPQENPITLRNTLVLSSASALGVSVRGFFEGFIFAILANIHIANRISEDTDSGFVRGMGSIIDVLAIALLTALTYQLATAVTTGTEQIVTLLKEATEHLTCFSNCAFFESGEPDDTSVDPLAQSLLSTSTMINQYGTGN